MGHGWRVDGLSEITRCPKTIVQDNVKRGITLTVEDQFCLDGQRLLLVSGTHGAAAEYRLQVDSFSKIVSFGSNTAKGPDSWEIRTKRGQIFTFGGTADATIEAQGVGRPVLTWALSRVKDQRSNYYDIQYVKSNDARLGEYYPDRIRYTGNLNGALLPYNAVSFVYEDRPDPWLGFVAGSRMTHSKRLTSIRTTVLTAADGSAGTLAREFRIAYTVNSRNGRSLVDHITDCDGVGNCLPPTSFTWTTRDLTANTFEAPGSGNWGGPQVTLTSVPADGDSGQQVKSQVMMGDFNGDGRPDLVRSDGSGMWTVCLSTGSNFDCQNWAGPAVVTRDAIMGDFNGDGLTDIAVYPHVDGPGNWNVCLSTGSGFNCSTWPGYGATNWVNGGVVSGALVGDFDGDGRDDIALSGYNSGSELLCKSTGSGFVDGTCQSYPGSNQFMYWPHYFTEGVIQAFARNQMSGDFDGDGRADFVQLVGHRTVPTDYPPGTWNGIRATDTGFVPFGIPSTGQVMLDGESGPGETRFVDVTGDSYGPLGDIVTGFISDNVTSVPKAEICRSNGATMITCLNLPNVDASNSQIHAVGDVDGDGRPDLIGWGGVCQMPLLALGAGNADQYGYVCEPWTTAALPTNIVQFYYGDFNGDGRADVAVYSKTSPTTGYWTVHLAGHGGFQDLLSTVTNGVGHQTTFVYKGLNDPAVYLPGALPSYPKANSKVVSPVVASMSVSNGIGGWLKTDYTYQANRSDLTGRGNLGFEITTALDHVKNVRAKTTSSQDFPYIGMPLEQRATKCTLCTPADTGGVVLSLRTNTYDSFLTTAGAVFPYLKSSTTDKTDLDGTPTSRTLTQVNPGGVNTPRGVDAYGNVTDSTETVSPLPNTGDSFTTHTVNTYLNQTTPWLLGLLTSSVTTRTAFQLGADPSAQSITFNSPGTQTVGTAPPALSAWATSGLAVSFASTTPAVCIVSGTALTVVTWGTCTITADQAGNSYFLAAAQVSNTFPVNKTAQSITFTAPATQTYGVAAPTLIATSTSGLAVSFSSTTTAVCTVSGTALTLVNSGSCTVTANQAGNATYAAAAQVSNTFTVNKAAQTIAFTGPATQTMGTPPPPLSATATSGLAVNFASTTPAVCTVSGTALTLVAPGSCVISATQLGNSYYSAAPPVSRTFSVYSATTTLTRTPTLLDWGTVTGTGVTKLVTVQNTGQAPTTLTFTLAYISGSIGMGTYSTALPETTCTSGQSLGIGASCVVAVNFNPGCTAHGMRNGTLTLSGSVATSVVVSLNVNSNKTTLCI